jgi:hypothetical protein
MKSKKSKYDKSIQSHKSEIKLDFESDFLKEKLKRANEILSNTQLPQS